MACFAFGRVQRRDRFRSSSICRNFDDSATARQRRENDFAVLTPKSSARGGCIANDDRDATLDRELAQLFFRKESHPTPVRREKRLSLAFGLGPFPCLPTRDRM